LIYELGDNYDEDFSHIQKILDTENSPNIFIVSKSTNSDLILKAMQTGVTNFFPLPLEKDRLKKALLKIQHRAGDTLTSNEKRSRIINVIGSKGGVGTTTIAVNLAVDLALNEPSKSVALIDMNPLYGEVSLFLDIQSTYTWGELVKNIDRVDTIYLMNALSRHESGLHVLLSPESLNGQPVDIDNRIGQMLTLMRQQFDFIVIDSGQRMNQAALQTIHMSNTVLLISTLSLPCLSNTNKLLGPLEKLGLLDQKNFHIIVNRLLKNSSITLKEAEKSINKDIYWTVPNEFNVSMSSINQGVPLMRAKPRSKIAKRINELAKTISSHYT
jgi:pilus assembly protein CpaE